MTPLKLMSNLSMIFDNQIELRLINYAIIYRNKYKMSFFDQLRKQKNHE